MPEHFRRAIGVDKAQHNQIQTLDLTSLTDQEEKIIQAVIHKDELEKSILDAKISEVRKEIKDIRKAGALTDGDDQNTICARCKFKFMPFLVPWVDHGQRCTTCKFKVCANCRTRQANGLWLCILCFKYRQEKLLTGEWMSKGQSNLYGSDLLRASLRDRSQTRSGYEETGGGNYIQRPAKVKDDNSDDSDTSKGSPPRKDRPEELRKQKASSQRSPTPISSTSLQSFKNKDSSQQPTHEISHIRRAAHSTPPGEAGDDRSMVKQYEGTSTGHSTPKLQLIASTPFTNTIMLDDVDTSLSLDNHPENVTDDKDKCSDNNHSNEADASNPAKINQPHSSHIPFPPHKDPSGKRARLSRNISVSEQNLYSDDVKHATIPQFSSLDSRSISSLCSDYSLNPKYRTTKRASGTSELELFRKRGERYSLKRKKTLENESSVEKDDSKLEIIEDNTTKNSNENQTSSTVVKPTLIPHWHEILRVQSIVESLTKQNKSPIITCSPIKRSDTSVDYNIFPLMNPPKNMPTCKDSKNSPPNNSRESSSSQESISVCVASYMSPDVNPDIENIFASTPNASNGLRSTYKSSRRRDLSPGAQISPFSAPTLHSSQEEMSPGSNQSNDVGVDPGRRNISPRRHKSLKSYFSIMRSRNWLKLKDWRGKRKLPSVEKIKEAQEEKGRGDNDKVNWSIIQHQNSCSHALDSEKVAINSPKGNTDRMVCWWKDDASNSVHANDETETVILRKVHDSDTSSLSSSTTDSQYASSSANTNRSYEDCRSLGDDRGTAVTVTSTSTVLPSKFRFRRSSSSVGEVQRGGPEECSSPQSNVTSIAAMNTPKGSTQSATSDSSAGHHNHPVDAMTSNEDKNKKLPRGSDTIKGTLSRSEDSFEDVYNSNANLYVQMMNCESQDNVKGNISMRKRVLPQCPLDGKHPQFMLQQSLSLSEEMAQNAIFQSFEESESDGNGGKNKRTAEGVEEEKLLLPSEIRKNRNLWNIVVSTTSSRRDMRLQKSKLPIKNTSSLSVRDTAMNKITPDMSKEGSLTENNEKIQSQVSQISSPHFQKTPELVMAKKSHLEVKDQPEVVETLRGIQGGLAGNLSRSGSNISDNFSVVTEISEQHGEAESYDYNSDQGSDDTFHNSTIGNSFSDDDDDGSKADVISQVQPYKELKSLNDDNISDDRTESKNSRWNAPRNYGDLKKTGDYLVQKSDNSMCLRDEGDITSQKRKALALEDSNPTGCFLEGQPSIDSHISDLDDEDVVSSTESQRDVKPDSSAKPRGEKQRAAIEGSYHNDEESERDEGVDEVGKLMDARVKVESPDDNNRTTAISVVDVTYVDKTGPVYALGKKSQKKETVCSDNSYNISLPHADVDLDDSCNKATSLQAPEPVRDAGGGVTDGTKGRISNNERFRLQPAANADHLAAPVIAVTSMAVVEQNVEEEEEDDLDELFSNHHPNKLLGSRSSLADSRESIYSIYSDAGEVNYGGIRVTGEIMFDLTYNYTSSTFDVHIIQCKDLAPVDAKHNKSDPYVKTYLLPDKSRNSKRKTRIKKHTLGPVFDEVLKYQISKNELETRSLWVTVWHNDRFGRNDFLGEVTIPLDYYGFDESAPRWYTLQERAGTQDPMMSYKGDLFLSLKYVTPDMADASPKKKSGSARKKGKDKDKPPQPGLGEVHVLVKEAQNLTAMRGSAGSDPFCKGYLLPDVAHASKQKTPVIKKTCNPQWHSILTFEGVDQSQLPLHGLELTIWDYERLSSNDFLGGVRLGLGKGADQGKSVEWMDSRGEEIEAWQSMIDHPNDWIDIQLPLRVSMGKQSIKK